jgi:hypothetical protein
LKKQWAKEDQDLKMWWKTMQHESLSFESAALLFLYKYRVHFRVGKNYSDYATYKGIPVTYDPTLPDSAVILENDR